MRQSVLPPVPLSAAQREAQRVAYVQAVDHMARVLGLTVPQVDGLITRIDTVERHIKRHEPSALARIDELERRTAVLNSSFMARLRWLVLGR